MYVFCLVADGTNGGTSDNLYLLCLLVIVLVFVAVLAAVGCVWRKRKPARVGCQGDGKTAFYHAVQSLYYILVQ